MGRKLTKNIAYWTISILLCSLTWLTSGCKDDFTNDGKYKLSFSVDTLKIDTFLTNTTSPTEVIMVYNNNEEDIKISVIQLETERRFFKINVNGKAGELFSDVKISAKDSLFIFVQISGDELGKEEPLLIEDKIKFIYNGNSQEVVLSTYGQDAYHFRQPFHIQTDTKWAADKPYLIYDSIIVDPGVTWTIAEGATLYLKNRATFVIDGTIKTEGTTDKRIVFRTYRKDKYTQNKSYDQMVDQWGGIHITASSTGNVFNNTLIRGGSFGIEVDSAEINESEYRLTLLNSQIHNVGTSCLKASHANIYAVNSILSNGKNGSVILACGSYWFDHCTITSFNQGMGFYKSGVTLSTIGFVESKSEANAPIDAQFHNCIVMGSNKDDLMILQAEDITDTTTLHYLFNHCLVHLDKKNDLQEDTIHFVSTLFNEDPQFQIVDQSKVTFDFHLKEESPCIEAGDLGVVLKREKCQTDFDGVTREIERAPEMGALQFVAKTEEEEEEEAQKQ